MLLAGLVVGGDASGDDGGETRLVERCGRRRLEELLDHAQQVASVAVGHGDQRGASALGERQPPAGESLRALEELGQADVVEAVQDEDLAARQERTVELEAGVLGGRAHKHDRAVLDVGQQAVLLSAVETVHLVDEQKRAPAAPATSPSRGKNPPQIGHPGESRRDLLDVESDARGEQPGDRRLAAAGRAPQDDRGQPTGLHHPPQRGVGGKQVALPDHLLQGARTQPVGQGTVRDGAAIARRRGVEECGGVLGAHASRLRRSPGTPAGRGRAIGPAEIRPASGGSPEEAVGWNRPRAKTVLASGEPGPRPPAAAARAPMAGPRAGPGCCASAPGGRRGAPRTPGDRAGVLRVRAPGTPPGFGRNHLSPRFR